MKRITILTAILFTLVFSAKAQFTPSKEIYEKVTSLVSQCEHPFKEWSNDTVGSLSRSLYIKFGVVPKPQAKGDCALFLKYTVQDVTAEGLRVIPYNLDYQKCGDIFIEGVKGLSDRTYSVTYARRIGDYTYNTAMGSSRTIPRYEYGKPITADEYAKKFKEQH